MIVVRSDRPIDDGVRKKISLFCDVRPNAVISAVDADDIYEVPLHLHAGGLDSVICSRLGIETPPPELTGWETIVDRARHATDDVTSASTSTCRTRTCRWRRRCGTGPRTSAAVST